MAVARGRGEESDTGLLTILSGVVSCLLPSANDGERRRCAKPMARSGLINPWSLSTTVRNPERLVGFLSALDEMEGAVWDNMAQVRFQTILIQRRLYGYGEPQFYAGLDEPDRRLLESEEPVAFADAQRYPMSARA